MTEYDAVVVGSGPNGLVAAITIAREGRRVLVVEGRPTAGGGTRSAELTEPGFVHDVCSAVHPLGVASPALRALPLDRHGLRWVFPPIPLAHPLDAHTVLLERSVEATSSRLGVDAKAWTSLMAPVVDGGFGLIDDVLSPLSPPRHPIRMARFGLHALRSATGLTRATFAGTEAPALFAGAAAHAIQPFDRRVTAGVGIFFAALGHLAGWPLAEGGSQAIADALVAELRAHGGDVECGRWVSRLDELPSSRVVLADVVPRNLVAIAGDRLPARVRKRYLRFRHGPAAFKLDYALSDPVPWRDPKTATTATVHVGGTFDEIAAAEQDVASGRHPERPFVLVSQPSLFDRTRAPAGRHTLWAYCHVPNGSTVDMTVAVESQIERFAPGFRETIISRRRATPAEIEADNPNYVGGDIAGGVADLRQLFARPVVSLRPWATGAPGLYLCSSSTPPGAGVHGMCGLHAAKLALRRELR